MKFTAVMVFATIAVNGVQHRRRVDDCVYDSMHKVGGTIVPCDYTPNIVSSVTIGDSAVPAFDVDGAHLQSRGAMKYLKELGGYTDFVKCSSPDCPELSVAR